MVASATLVKNSVEVRDLTESWINGKAFVALHKALAHSTGVGINDDAKTKPSFASAWSGLDAFDIPRCDV